MKHPRSWIPTKEKLEGNRWLAWLKPFLGHPRLWHWSRRGVALGVALGIFFGLLIPLAQIPLTAAAAVILRANIPAAAASTLITNPVTFGPIYYGAYRLGLWVTGGETPVLSQEALLAHEERQGEELSIWSRLSQMGLPLVIGLAILSSVMGVLAYVVITLVWRWQVLSKRRKRSKS